MWDAIGIVAWLAAWVVAAAVAELLGRRDARRATPRRCRGVRVWTRD